MKYVQLTALETLFVRNHNQIAQQLRRQHPGWTDEQLYQESRKLNIAEYQQIVYQQSPYIPTAYPESVEAYNYKDWQGWQATPGKGGGVFFTSPVMASYLTVHPSTAAAAGGSSSKALLIGLIVAIVVVIAVVALVVTLRGRSRQVEETV